MLTCLGRDELGKRSLAEIERLGVKRTYVQIDPEYPTPAVVVTLGCSHTCPRFKLIVQRLAHK